MSAPITVAITRQVDPAHEDQMIAWLRAGTQLAERFDGFLGCGWVRSGPDSTEWHMLYRFADDAALRAWEQSEQRRWWLDSAKGFVERQRHEMRTGIEGWFDEPTSRDAEDLRAPLPAPPRWKQMIAIFIVFWPISLISNQVSSLYLGSWPLPLRVTASVLIITPLMTYVMLPWITGLLRGWLHAPPRTWKV